MKYAIIAENDESQWDDKTGVSYNFPAKYQRILTPGTRAIYYKGKQKNKRFENKRLSKDPHYFGVAVIGESTLDKKAEKKEYYCDILTFKPFDTAVPFKLNEDYIEPIPSSKESNYWRDGVREVTKETFDKILELASVQFESSIEISDFIISQRELDEAKNLISPAKFNALEVSTVNNNTNRKLSTPNNTINDGNVNWGKENERKRLKGRKAELYVMEFERQFLTDAGCDNLAAMVKDYSKKYSKGFDVLSWNPDGSERNIEVKSSSSNGFIITRNELKQSQLNPNYWIYIVTEMKNEVRIKKLKSPNLRDQERYRLEPKDYYVSFSIEH